MRIRPISAAVAIALVATALAASIAVAGTTTGSNGNSLTADAKIKPTKLSKTAPTPVALDINTKASTTSPVASAVMDFDRNGTYLPKGLPTCGEKKLLGKDSETAVELCGKAMIGTGSATALVTFLGAEREKVNAKLSVFNGAPKGGKPTLLIHAFAAEPVPAGFVFSGVVSKYNKEGFGTRFEIDFPKLFGGSGVVSEFNVKIAKTFTYKGKKQSLVNAKCPSSRKLKARISFTYQDGETLAVPVTQSCQQKS